MTSEIEMIRKKLLSMLEAKNDLETIMNTLDCSKGFILRSIEGFKKSKLLVENFDIDFLFPTKANRILVNSIDENSFYFQTRVSEYQPKKSSAKISLPFPEVRKRNLQDKQLKITVEIIN